MFGGAGLYRDDYAFGMIARDTAYMKVDDTNRNKYIKEGCVQLKPFEKSGLVLSFYSIPPDGFENADEFIEWAKESLAIQNKLAAQKQKKTNELAFYGRTI